MRRIADNLNAMNPVDAVDPMNSVDAMDSVDAVNTQCRHLKTSPFRNPRPPCPTSAPFAKMLCIEATDFDEDFTHFVVLCGLGQRC